MNFYEVWEEFWKSCVVIIGAMLLLRIAGRKSISQMTIPTTVIMISIGTVIVQPIADKSIWLALVAAVTFIVILLLMEYLELKWNWFEILMRGRAVTVIREGRLQEHELKKLRMTVDQLEMKLRQTGIARFEDIKTLTVETNGLIGYEYMPEAQPVTFGQVKALMEQYWGNGQQGQLQTQSEAQSQQQGQPQQPKTEQAPASSVKSDLFKELSQGEAHHENKTLN
ncbi:DUF421 domain-containing protein [Paenibacillus massiliensis]|uniref:DUF421 domain-containing protein n=1 Tax=Paenibacillus massiliensis TaxID=225917 RepID=UPI00048F83D2|nr:DUF421 domain-containing protein [Paenibacillus massiliensis]